MHTYDSNAHLDAGEEEVYNKARKCQTDYEQLQSAFETTLSAEDSDIYKELMEKYTVDIQVLICYGISCGWSVCSQ